MAAPLSKVAAVVLSTTMRTPEFVPIAPDRPGSNIVLRSWMGYSFVAIALGVAHSPSPPRTGCVLLRHRAARASASAWTWTSTGVPMFLLSLPGPLWWRKTRTALDRTVRSPRMSPMLSHCPGNWHCVRVGPPPLLGRKQQQKPLPMAKRVPERNPVRETMRSTTKRSTRPGPSRVPEQPQEAGPGRSGSRRRWQNRHRWKGLSSPGTRGCGGTAAASGTRGSR